MKKILLLLLISFISKPDYTSFGFGVGTSGDVDTIAIGYEQVDSKFRFVTLAGRSEVFDVSLGVYSAGLDYAFGNFNEGSFYAGLTYSRAAIGDVAESDTLLGVGYGKISGEGLDYILEVDSEGDVSTGITQWTEDGLGIGVGVAFTDYDEAITLSLQYQF